MRWDVHIGLFIGQFSRGIGHLSSRGPSSQIRWLESETIGWIINRLKISIIFSALNFVVRVQSSKPLNTKISPTPQFFGGQLL
jgi:hypothetical protein